MSLSVLQRIAQGDATAVGDCINEFSSLVWGMSRRMSRSSFDAEDATQEIFVEIWRHAGRFDPSKGSDSVFIATIARRRLIDRVRKVKRQPLMDPLEVLEFATWSRHSDLGPEASIDIDHALRVFAQLRVEQRKVLELALLDGLSQTDIAVNLKMPLGTVKSCMRRGVLRVRELMFLGNVAKTDEAAPPAHSLGRERRRSQTRAFGVRRPDALNQASPLPWRTDAKDRVPPTLAQSSLQLVRVP